MTLNDLNFTPPVIAHRGVRVEAPENTLAALKLVAESGARWIETDIKLTHDGVAILMHDDMLDRTTNGHGLVADMTWAEIQKLDAGSWFNPTFANERIPQLSETLNYVIDHNLRINLELKPCEGRTQATTMVALIETAKVWPMDYPPPLISSFDIKALVIAAQLHPDWPRAILLDKWRDDWRLLVRQINAVAVSINAESLTKEHVDEFRQSHIPVLAYTVNDPVRAKELLHWGVSAVFSDNPREIIKAL